MIENNQVAEKAFEIYGSSQRVWMGITDTDTENLWKYISTGTLVPFLNWLPGQPNSAGGNQDCGYIDASSSNHNGQWGDESCNGHFNPKWICEL